MKPITLTYEKVLKAARKAYKEGRLGFQNRKKKCMYFYPGDKDIRCAIGAALPKRFKNDPGFPNEDDISLLKNENFVDMTSEDWNKLVGLQDAHDNACQLKGERRRSYVNDFKALLGV